jgi:hypothetical protein
MKKHFALPFATLAVFGMSMTGSSFGQTSAARSIQDQITGSWSLISNENVKADGSKFNPIGANPKGKMIFDGHGNFVIMTRADKLPKITSGNRMAATDEEYKTILRGVNAYYGTYKVDEPSKTLTFKIEGATFPNWEGQEQKRPLVFTGADQMSYSNSSPTTGEGTTTLTWKRTQ